MRSLERVMAILEVTQRSSEPVSPSFVVASTGLSISTVSRLMRELLAEGLLEKAPGESTYILGARLMNLARHSPSSSDLVETALPLIYKLRDLTQETVSLHIRRGDSRVCVAGAESIQPIRRVLTIGVPNLIHQGSPGAILMSQVDHKEISEYFARLNLPKAKRSLFDRFLAQAKKNGYVIDEEDIFPGISGISVPVLDSNGSIQASLAVSGPATRWGKTKMMEFLPDILSTANLLTGLSVPGRYLGTDQA